MQWAGQNKISQDDPEGSLRAGSYGWTRRNIIGAFAQFSFFLSAYRTVIKRRASKQHIPQRYRCDKLRQQAFTFNISVKTPMGLKYWD
jgi:hypothetical protein